MTMITDSHFGGNIILTRDSVQEGKPFKEVLNEISFSNFRYPGGGITEDQTWENGGLDRMFGDPMDRNDPNYVMTIREALQFADERDVGLTIVTPTYQFFDKETDTFDHHGFNRYLAELEKALGEFPSVKIVDFEIGNEYWGSKNFGSLEASEYGKIANAEISSLNAMSQRLMEKNEDWEQPGIGIQAGSQWRAIQDASGKWHPTGVHESHEIAQELSLDNRELVTTIFQHSYPDPLRNANGDWQQDWAMDPMKVFEGVEGFSNELKLTLSEFNMTVDTVTGTSQGAAWIEVFSSYVDRGIDEFHHWGISYQWLSNKYYDLQFPPAESDGGRIIAKPTPMGQVYDVAKNHLIGKETMIDRDAVEGMEVPDGMGITGFQDDSQRIVFLHNWSEVNGTIDLSGIAPGKHVTVQHLIDADSPYSNWYDESLPVPPGPGEIADARGDMNVVSGGSAPDAITLNPGEMAVIVISDPDRDLLLEGAHHVTDPRTGMVDDHMIGGDGNDIIRGHVGDDTLEGGGGRNVISGGRGDDFTIAGGEGDIIFADAGHDTIHGGDGDDLIVVSSDREDDLAEIWTGGGLNTVLIGDGAQAIIHDFTDDDMLGFDGAFCNPEMLREASRVEDKDLVVDLPNGGVVRLIGQADRIEHLADSVHDFRLADENDEDMPDTESIDPEEDDDTLVLNGDTSDDEFDAGLGLGVFQGLTYEQVNEVFDLMGDVDGKNDQTGDGTSYFSSREDVIRELGVKPSVPGRPSEPEDPDNPDDDGEQDPSDASGGSCFVATAAYGDGLHPDVVALRRFRDKHLCKFRAGRAFIRIYWIIGPVLARHTKPQDTHAKVAKVVLRMMVSALRKAGLC